MCTTVLYSALPELERAPGAEGAKEIRFPGTVQSRQCCILYCTVLYSDAVHYRSYSAMMQDVRCLVWGGRGGGLCLCVVAKRVESWKGRAVPSRHGFGGSCAYAKRNTASLEALIMFESC